MSQTVQQRFDKDYQIVRKLVLKGRCSLATAKAWLTKHGRVAAVNMLIERRRAFEKFMSTRVERELDEIHKDEIRYRREDEDA